MNVSYWHRDGSDLCAKNLSWNVFPHVSASLLPFHHCFDNRTLIIFVKALVSVNFFIALQSGAILHNLTLPNFKDLQGVQNFAGRILSGSEKHTVLAHNKTLMRKRPSCRELQ